MISDNKIPLKDSDGNIVFEASKKKRFINFLIDTTIWVFILYFLVYLSKEFPSLEYLFLGIFWFFMLGAYSIISEFLFRKTIGKYFTRTKVVFKYDVKPEFRLIVIRSLARRIPFEFLSLVMGIDAKAWHDVLSKTLVVDDTKSII